MGVLVGLIGSCAAALRFYYISVLMKGDLQR